jgi:hypothetical protein
VELTANRIIARTIERVRDTQFAGDAIYEFDKSLELVNASFSPLYWTMHQELEAEGKLHHSREQCPDKNGPREILLWERETGWKTVKIR